MANEFLSPLASDSKLALRYLHGDGAQATVSYGALRQAIASYAAGGRRSSRATAVTAPTTWAPRGVTEP